MAQETFGPRQAPKAVGLELWEWHQGRETGHIPDPDVGARWSAAVVAKLAENIDDLRAVIGEHPPGGWATSAQRVGLDQWQWEAAAARKLLVRADRRDGWSSIALGAIRLRLAEIIAAVGTERPRGAEYCSERLGTQVDAEVWYEDIVALVERGLLTKVATFKDCPLYDPRDIDRLGSEHRQTVLDLVRAREGWRAASVPPREARELLGWREYEFARVTAEQGVEPGRYGRYALRDVHRLRDDTELMDRVRRGRRVGAANAAAMLGIRPLEFRYLEDLGVVAGMPCEAEVAPGIVRTVLRYEVGEIEDLERDVPDIDWDALRGVARGERSPLRDRMPVVPPSRAAIIRQFVGVLAESHGVDVWARYDSREDRWEIDWAAPAGAEFSADTIRKAIAGDKVVAQYRGEIIVSTAAGGAVRWARRMLEPGAACILHVETTGLAGAVVEVSVIEASSGETLLETLVNPGEMDVEPDAFWMHRIPADQLAVAPRWPEVLPRLLAAVGGGRAILGYNAEWSRGRVLFDCARYDVDAGVLDTAPWGCVMDRRSQWERTRRWRGLGGPNRSLADVRRAREILCDMAEGVRR